MTKDLVSKFENLCEEQKLVKTSHTDFSLEKVKAKILVGAAHFWFIKNDDLPYENCKVYKFIWETLFNHEYFQHDFIFSSFPTEERCKQFSITDKFIIAALHKPSDDFCKSFPDLVIY